MTNTNTNTVGSLPTAIDEFTGLTYSLAVTGIYIDIREFDTPLVYATLTTPLGSLGISEWLNDDGETVDRIDSNIEHNQSAGIAALLNLDSTPVRHGAPLNLVWDAMDAALAAL